MAVPFDYKTGENAVVLRRRQQKDPFRRASHFSNGFRAMASRAPGRPRACIAWAGGVSVWLRWSVLRQSLGRMTSANKCSACRFMSHSA